MAYDSDKQHRRSIRLKGYDYTQAGAYFITTCTQDRVCLFGEVADGDMRLNDAGRMIRSVWDEMPVFYPGVDIDEFIVMPNHIHGIIIVGAAPRGRPDSVAPQIGQPQGVAPTGWNVAPQIGQPQGVAPTLSAPDVVHRFKTLTTKRYADGVKQSGWPPFPGRVWQRNYYEHIIRNDVSLNRIRQYILDNPLRWSFDRENPETTAAEPEDAWAH